MKKKQYEGKAGAALQEGFKSAEKWIAERKERQAKKEKQNEEKN
jgi:hypothetical protein